MLQLFRRGHTVMLHNLTPQPGTGVHWTTASGMGGILPRALGPPPCVTQSTGILCDRI